MTWKNRLSSWVEAHPLQTVAVLTPIVSAIVVGILQEIANRIIDTEIAPWLGQAASVYRWVVIGAIVLFIVMAARIWQQSLHQARHMSASDAEWPAATHKRMKEAEAQLGLLGAHFKSSMETLETLVGYLSDQSALEWDGANSAKIQQLLFPIILKRAQRMYAQPHMVQHACIFTPARDQPDYLTMYYSGASNGSQIHNDTQWYIGSDKKTQRLKGGTAGAAFINRRPLVRHINPVTHEAEEGRDYIPSRKPGDVPLYLSFVAMPLLDGEKRGARCLGVLCLDSLERDTFDGDPQVILEPAAKLLVQVLKLLQRVDERERAREGE